MCIEITGPNAYEYQYLATAYIALEYIASGNFNNEGLELIVEGINSEDAELRILQNGEPVVIEIQVKSTQTDLSQMDLANWLLHYTPRSSTKSLLSRLLEDNRRLALFITRARCQDNVRQFCDNYKIFPHSADKIPSSIRNALLEQLAIVLPVGNTPIQERRQTNSIETTVELRQNRSLLSDLCRRIIVWEQLSIETLENQLAQLMNRELLIPQSKLESVQRELIDAVRESRNQHDNVIPSVATILSKHAGTRLPLPQVYIPYPGLDDLRTEFRQGNLLLLTGISFSGKTCNARILANELQSQGYQLLETQSVYEAQRFLQPGSDDRICLLDDPFGSTGLSPDAPEIRKTLRSLRDNIDAHRKLIITSRIDVLRALDGENWIDNSALSPNIWHDISVKDKSMLSQLWTVLCAEETVNHETTEIVEQGLQEQGAEELLQPGHLVRLSKAENTNLAGKTFQELCTFAREDARDLSIRWRTSGNIRRDVVCALALGATHLVTIDMHELRFLLYGGDAEPGCPIKPFARSFSDYVLGEAVDDSEFPKYPVIPDIEEADRETLDHLEQHGYIYIREGRIGFTHPNYLEAARWVIKDSTSLQFEEFINMLMRALSCLHVKTSETSAKFIQEVFPSVLYEESRKEFFLHSAMIGLRSIFPTTCDILSIFLLSHFNMLNSDKQKQVIYSVTSNDEERLFWKAGEPWLHPKKTVMFSSQNIEDARQEAQVLLDDSRMGSVSPKGAWAVAICLMSTNWLPDNRVDLLNRLLSFNYAFIRERSAFVALRDYPEQFSERVFGDEHPRVVKAGIKGVFSACHIFNAEKRENISQSIIEALKRAPVAAATCRDLIEFGDYYSQNYIDWKERSPEEKRELWRLWARIFPVFMDSMPCEVIPLKETSVWYTANEGLKYIEPEDGVVIAEAWLRWIIRGLSRGKMPDNYGMAVMEFLVKVTGEENASIRRSLFEQILHEKDTALVFLSIAECVDLWEMLDQSEKEIILALSQSERQDSLWLSAVMLTRENIPWDLAEAILGQMISEDLSPKEVIELIPKPLLDCCLHVYCGRPQPLSWLGKHHDNDNLWIPILVHIISMPSHNCWELATSEMLCTVFNQSDPGDAWKNSQAIWSDLCKKSDRDLRKRLIKLILEASFASVLKISVLFWEELFNLIPAGEEREELIKTIINLSEVLEMHAGKGGIYSLLGYGELMAEIIKHLPSDLAILTLLSEKGTAENLLLENIGSIYKENVPKLIATHDLILRRISGMNDNPKYKEINDMVKHSRKVSFEIETKQSEKEYELRREIDGDLLNWVFTSTQDQTT